MGGKNHGCRLRETHATQYNEGDPNNSENRLERSDSTFRLQKNSGFCAVAFVVKASVSFLSISVSHIRLEEI